MNSSALTVIGRYWRCLLGLNHEGHFACAVSVHFDFANPMIADGKRGRHTELSIAATAFHLRPLGC